MKSILTRPLLLLALISIPVSLAFGALKKNEVVFREDFENRETVAASWSYGLTLSPDEKREVRPLVFEKSGVGQAVTIEKTESNGNLFLKRTFTPGEIARMKGSILMLTANLKTENLSKKKFPWSGAKIQCSFWTRNVKKGSLEETIGDIRPWVNISEGSFAWTNRGAVACVPEEVVAGVLVLGLESVSGKVSYDEVELKIIESLSVEDTWRGSDVKAFSIPRFRGAQVMEKVTEEDLRVLGETWKANVIRWNIGSWDRVVFDRGLDSKNFDALFQKEMEKTDGIAHLGKKYHMKVVLCAMGVSQYGLFKNVSNQNRFVECWRTLAARYRTNESIWAYDLSNEPHLDELAARESEEVLGWNDLTEKTALEIRKIDPVKTIMVEGCQGGQPDGFYFLRPIRTSNVVYSPHMYVPSHLTHQGIYGNKLGVSYPSRDVDSEVLERGLKPVLDFQKKWKVPIFVGEFSCIRWAPDGSAARYLSDCTALFEKYGWGGTYHCFRDWHGWDPEYPEDRLATNRSPVQTESEKALRAWFAKNIKTAD